MLEDGGSSRNTVVGRLTHKQEHIDGSRVNLIVLHQLDSCLICQIGGTHIFIHHTALYNTNILDGLFDFFLGDEITQILIKDDVPGNTSRHSPDAYTLVFDGCHKNLTLR